MQLLLPGHAPRLADWASRPFSPGSETGPRPSDLRLTFRHDLGREAPGAPVENGPHQRASHAVLAYDIFPPQAITSVLARTPVEVGDTVGAAYHVLGGLRLFFASRVIARFDAGDAGVHRTGFTYRTLAGHPELGEETFAVEKDVGTGEVRASLTSWSRPGLVLTWLARPVLRAVQRRANEAALVRLADVARG